MELDVVAEGIELPEQCEFLKALGCRTGRGIYLRKLYPPQKLLNGACLVGTSLPPHKPRLRELNEFNLDSIIFVRVMPHQSFFVTLSESQ